MIATALDHLPAPPCARLLGWNLLDARPQEGWIRIGFDGNRDFSIPRLKMPYYVTLDLAASYRLSETWSLFGRIENATDTHYQSPDGFLRPGIGAYGGIKVNL